MRDDKAVTGFAALGNPTRLAIFRTLVQAGGRGLAIGAVQEAIGIPLSTLAHHLAVLVQAGLVNQERQGRTVLCRADYAVMGDLVAYLTENCCKGVPGEASPGRTAREEIAGP